MIKYVLETLKSDGRNFESGTLFLNGGPYDLIWAYRDKMGQNLIYPDVFEIETQKIAF